MRVLKTILKLWKIYVIFTLSILLSFTFEAFSFGYENILLLFIVSEVLIIMGTRSYWFGFVSAIIFVLFFNFFFTEPKYTFIIEESRYVITLIIFLIVSFLISSLMQKLHQEAARAKESERKTKALYDVAKELLSIGNPSKINIFFSEIIQKSTGIKNYLFMDGKTYSAKGEELDIKRYLKDIDFAIKTGSQIGFGTLYKPELALRIIGITGVANHKIAVLLETANDLKAYEQDFITAIINLYLIVMQKEAAKLDEENSRLFAENERFKNQVLRSISHDLRTPLTSVLTGSTLLFNDNGLDDKTRKEIVSEIIDEVDSMSLLIDNILQMTKFQNQEVVLKKTKESVDDLVSRAVANINKRLDKHTLNIDRSDEVIIAKVDAKLIIQVITNLLDNAIQHTRVDSAIAIKYGVSGGKLHMLVSDNGGGIKEADMQYIFDSEYYTNTKKDNKRGFGLGLNICKAIIEKHEGSISAYNNSEKGATFEIILPL